MSSSLFPYDGIGVQGCKKIDEFSGKNLLKPSDCSDSGSLKATAYNFGGSKSSNLTPFSRA